MSLPAKVLVANRGEIAVRIIRTLRELGIGSVVVYHAVDARSRAVREADESVELFGEPPVRRYLDVEQIIAACAATPGRRRSTPASASSPRTPTSPQAVIDAGLIFVGPAAGRDPGDGRQDRVQAARQGGRRSDPARLRGRVAERRRGASPKPTGSATRCCSRPARAAAARACGSPAIPQACRDAFERASREAQASFGDGRVFVERYIERPRHIEVQVLADGHGTSLHLGERECSIQRRYQKVIEEAPVAVHRPGDARRDGRTRGRARPRRRLRLGRHGRDGRRRRRATSTSWR